jgi:ribonuclease Z
MSLLRFTFLGTSAAQPTIHRNLSGLAVKADSDLLLFDCGEGSQRQMIRYGTGFAVDVVFFTHFHADHYLGIIGFLRTLGMMGREEKLVLYGPAPAKRLLNQAVHLGVDQLGFPLEIVELKDGDRIQRHGYSVRAVGVQHRINALGYVLEEDVRAGRFNLDKARALGVREGPDFGRLQRGESVVALDGKNVKASDVMGTRPARPEARAVRRHPPVRCAGGGGAPGGRPHPRVDLLRRRPGPGARDAALDRARGRTGRPAGRGAPADPHPPELALRHRLRTPPRPGARGVPGPVEVAHDGLTVDVPVRE